MADEAPDATPSRGVSSLRSKFESLGQEPASAYPSPIPRRGSTQPSENHAQLPSIARASLDIPRPSGGLQVGLGIKTNPPPSPQPRGRRGGSIDQRPYSMVDLPARHASPPAVTVDSPKSPPKQLSPRIAALKPTRSPQPGSLVSRSFESSTSPSPKPFGIHGRNGFSASQESLHSPKQPHSPGHSPRSAPSKPPPVNRAGKPKLGGNLAAKPTQQNIPASEKRISPFSTPPSSSEGTPNELPSSPSVNERTKPRHGSLGTGSNGYFVPPPVHHTVQQRRQEIKPVARASTLPHESPRQDHEFGTDSLSQKPGLQSRSNKIPASGRTSPVRQPMAISHSVGSRAVEAHSIVRTDSNVNSPSKRAQPSALTQGFDRSAPPPPPPTQKVAAPAPPAPRRSLDIRRSLETRRSFENRREPPPPPPSNGTSKYEYAETAGDSSALAPTPDPSAYPDPNLANRRPPQFKERPWEIFTGYDTRLCAVCGDYVCSTGYMTRVWNIRTGESLVSISHGDTVKVTAVAWKPATQVEDEGQHLWLGTNVGDIHELDISAGGITKSRSNVHARSEIIKMYRYASSVWSLDDQGKLHVWRPGNPGMPNLDSNFNVFRVPRNHSASIAVGESLWYASGKDIRVFKPNAASDEEFQVLSRPMCQEEAGDITSAATISTKPNEVYFGHADGKVSVYDRTTFACIGLYNVSMYKITAMTGVGSYLWAGYLTGMAYVYDTSTTPWTVKKDWRAHDSKIIANIVVDHSSIWKMNRLQVVTLGGDCTLRIWDGMLEQDWLQDRMKEQDGDYCTFQEVTAAVMTWNAGASKPTWLRNDPEDSRFFRDYLTSNDAPDIFVFGFQELVDLEDKKVTAKSFFKSKKNKDPSEQEHMSHQYRTWRDHLVRCIDEHLPSDHTYTVLHTTSMVGLFSCIFVKSSLRTRISHVSHAEVKRGMGGHHGNKGALIIRMVLDDSSICFVNCHLAAGQTQTINRNNDIAEILGSENLPMPNVPFDTFTGGGDGSMILDHEVTILNGDLNYRIDAMTRDNVVRAVKDNNLTKLLDRDQLLLSRKRNPGFRLRLFQEMPITFAPTYKYNLGTKEYDTSEKRRSPAWCDRLLYRGIGRIKCTEYRRWELHISDHRPVTGRFKMRVKSMDQAKRKKVLNKTVTEYERYSEKVAHSVKLDYLTNVLGLSQSEAVRMLR